LRARPQRDVKRDADFEAVAGEREREQPFGPVQAVQDRVAVGAQGPAGTGGAELLADVLAHRVAQFTLGIGQLPEDSRSETHGRAARPRSRARRAGHRRT
jgi:hypothetical protein